MVSVCFYTHPQVDPKRVYLLVNFFCGHKVVGNLGDVWKHDVLCDNLQGLNSQGTSGLDLF